MLYYSPVRQAVGGGRRSLVVTRSTYPGDGAISGRWLGDNTADWVDMKLSIIGKHVYLLPLLVFC